MQSRACACYMNDVDYAHVGCSSAVFSLCSDSLDKSLTTSSALFFVRRLIDYKILS